MISFHSEEFSLSVNCLNDILHHNCVGLLAAFKCYLPTRSRRISRLNQNFKWSNKIFKFCFRVKSSKHTTSHWHKSKELQELITSFILQSFVRRKLNAWHFLLRKHPVFSNNSEQYYTVRLYISVYQCYHTALWESRPSYLHVLLWAFYSHSWGSRSLTSDCLVAVWAWGGFRDLLSTFTVSGTC